jgi:hypothetical protein
MLDGTSVIPFDPGSSLGPLAAFLWAAGGSLGLEVISLYNEIRSERATGLPLFYKSWVFWLVRLCVTAIAGALAVAEGATRPLIAVNIGASAPAILQLLSSGSPAVGLSKPKSGAG